MLDKLRGIVGPAHVLIGADCAPYIVDGRAPEAVVLPASKEEVAAVLVAAGEAQTPVIPWGGGTKMGIGAPPQRVGLVLALKRLARLLEHEPGDLTATVQAGMTLGALQRELGARGQWLSLDPAHADEATLGGIVSSNAAGPRRHLYGACRDLVIGLTVVTATGALVKGGGKVVKNVAGYDLPKLFVGAFGTLGVIVEVTVKLRPRPDTDRMVVARFASLKEAGSAARAVMGSDLLPSALDLIDGETLRALDLGGPDGAALLIGVDGIAEQVHWQCAEVERMLRLQGLVDARVLDADARDAAWRGRGSLGRSAFPETAAVMKWVVLPAQVADVMEQGMGVAQRAGLPVVMAAHAGVGIIEAVLAGGAGADAARVSDVLTEWRALVRAVGGQALVESAPLAIKERVPVWDDPGPALRIMQRIKSQLDPAGLLNPGRFVEGI
jgi:glycolate dehydrogenase FAD-binding subunit